LQEVDAAMSDTDKDQVVTSTDEQKDRHTPEAVVEEETKEGAAEPEGESADVEALRQELDKQTKLAKYHLDQWKRTAADLENYRKRVEREREELRKFSLATLITELLPILDDFERAFQTLPATLSSLTWIDGVALIDRKLRVILERHGLKEIDALGKQFDPMFHEAVLQEENSAYPDGHVIAVLQKGYMLHDKVLRPAMVKIARDAEGKTEASKDKAEAKSSAAQKQKQDKGEKPTE